MTLSFTAPRDALESAVAAVASAVERRNTIPILANVLIESGADGLVLTATDLDIQITVETGLPASQPGATTVQAALLLDILRKLPKSDMVTFTEGGDGRVALTAGRSRFSLAALPAVDFPALPDRDQPVAFSMPAAHLAAAMAMVSFAISTEETRYYLNGIFMHTVEDGGETVLRLVATDGHRLARATLPCPEGAPGMPGIIIPRKSVGLLAKLLDKAGDDATVTVLLGEALITVSTGSTTLSSKLIDGTFPDYPRVIPQGNANTWRFEAQELARAAERVSIVSSEKGRGVKCSFGDAIAALTVNNPDSGSGYDEAHVARQTGDDVTIGFNARYLSELLGQMQARTVTMKLGDAGSPALFEPDMRDGDIIHLLTVLMPMRI